MHIFVASLTYVYLTNIIFNGLKVNYESGQVQVSRKSGCRFGPEKPFNCLPLVFISWSKKQNDSEVVRECFNTH